MPEGCGLAKAVFTPQSSPNQLPMLPLPSKLSLRNCAPVVRGSKKMAQTNQTPTRRRYWKYCVDWCFCVMPLGFVLGVYLLQKRYGAFTPSSSKNQRTKYGGFSRHHQSPLAPISLKPNATGCRKDKLLGYQSAFTFFLTLVEAVTFFSDF